MSGSSSESEGQVVVPRGGAEQELERAQRGVAKETLRQFQEQAGYQDLLRQYSRQPMAEMGEMYDPLSVFSPEQRQELVQQSYQQAIAGGRRAQELSDLELERIRRGAQLTPEQRQMIEQTSEAQLASGLSDISRYAEQQRSALATELAPRLGLHRADTPILDRGERIGAEAVNAAGRLVSDVRAQQAQSMLNYPLQARQLEISATQPQQALGYSREDVLADLNQRAFANRLALTGQTGQLGLGLTGVYNLPAGQQSLRPTLAQGESSTVSGGLSSRKVKQVLESPEAQEVLEKLKGLPVAFWHYLTDPSQEKHVGTFAEDLHAAFGLGDDQKINYQDLIGFLLLGVQALSERVDGLEKETA